MKESRKVLFSMTTSELAGFFVTQSLSCWTPNRGQWIPICHLSWSMPCSNSRKEVLKEI